MAGTTPRRPRPCLTPSASAPVGRLVLVPPHRLDAIADTLNRITADTTAPLNCPNCHRIDFAILVYRDTSTNRHQAHRRCHACHTTWKL